MSLDLNTIKGIAILDQDGNRILAKYYDTETFPSTKEQLAFEKSLFQKTYKANAEIILLDGLICVYRSNVDLFFYVMGSCEENELILMAALTCLYDSFAIVLRKNVEKKTLVDNMDIAMLIMDELCDNGVLMETDAQAVASRALRSDEITLSEQSLSQVGISFRVWEHIPKLSSAAGRGIMQQVNRYGKRTAQVVPSEVNQAGNDS